MIKGNSWLLALPLLFSNLALGTALPPRPDLSQMMENPVSVKLNWWPAQDEIWYQRDAPLFRNMGSQPPYERKYYLSPDRQFFMSFDQGCGSVYNHVISPQFRLIEENGSADEKKLTYHAMITGRTALQVFEDFNGTDAASNPSEKSFTSRTGAFAMRCTKDLVAQSAQCEITMKVYAVSQDED